MALKCWMVKAHASNLPSAKQLPRASRCQVMQSPIAKAHASPFIIYTCDLIWLAPFKYQSPAHATALETATEAAFGHLVWQG